jgi:hypothetical protein
MHNGVGRARGDCVFDNLYGCKSHIGAASAMPVCDIPGPPFRRLAVKASPPGRAYPPGATI